MEPNRGGGALMAGPFGLGDPEVFAGLPLPGSPVTASGEDPDEVRARMLGQGGAEPWKGSPWALPYNPNEGAVADADGVIADSKRTPAAPATPPAAPSAPAGGGGF